MKDTGASINSLEKYLSELYSYGYLTSEQKRNGNRYGKRFLYLTQPDMWVRDAQKL